jgi:hypothetical protein
MKRKRFKNTHINCVSLCKRGKNTIRNVYQSNTGALTISPLFQAAADFDEKGILHAIAWAPDFDNVEGISASREEVRQMAYSHLSEGARLNIEHNGRTLAATQAHTAESFLIQASDTRFAGWKSHDGRTVPHDGAWGLVIQIHDPALRQAYRDGEWDGVSIEGTAQVVLESETSGAGKDTDMDFAQLLALLQSLSESMKTIAQSQATAQAATQPNAAMAALTAKLDTVIESVRTAIAQATAAPAAPTAPAAPAAPQAQAAPQRPTFTGNPTDVAALAAHREKLLAESLRGAIDFNDPAQVEELIQSLDPDGTKRALAAQGQPAQPSRLSQSAQNIVRSLRGEAHSVSAAPAAPLFQHLPGGTLDPMSDVDDLVAASHTDPLENARKEEKAARTG